MAAPERAARAERSSGGWRRRRPEEHYHHLAISPSGLGATFRVRVTRRGVEVTWDYDAGVIETTRDAMTMARAADELRAALGVPTTDATGPRPAWMGSFVWTPPLPGVD